MLVFSLGRYLPLSDVSRLRISEDDERQHAAWWVTPETRTNSKYSVIYHTYMIDI